MQIAGTAECEDALVTLLKERHFLDDATIARARLAATQAAQSLASILVELALVEDETLADAYCELLGLSRASAEDWPEDVPAIPGISDEYLSQSDVLPLFADERRIVLATADPIDCRAARVISYFSGREVVLRVTTPAELRHAAAMQANIHEAQTLDPSAEYTDPFLLDGDAERLRDLANEAPVIKLLNRLIGRAVHAGASDIHFEPAESHLTVRFRVDGLLRTEDRLGPDSHLALLTRIKILAQLNIAERRLPQDGRLRLSVRGRNVDFRISTSPTIHGEAVVLRILDRRNVALDLDTLGFRSTDRQHLESALELHSGMVLVTGPTGSGKTTTLYAALKLLNSGQRKLFTIEDPVEYTLAGAIQIPVRQQLGLDFANILRSVLRQDPDIIMIGEIRDAETARIAAQAALTGHLVLATMHTNSSLGAVARLRDLGVADFVISSTLRCVIAQRLVRTACPDCSSLVHSTPCASCGGTGRRGRELQYDMLPVSPAICRAIAAGAGEASLTDIAKREGFMALDERIANAGRCKPRAARGSGHGGRQS